MDDGYYSEGAHRQGLIYRLLYSGTNSFTNLEIPFHIYFVIVHTSSVIPTHLQISL